MKIAVPLSDGRVSMHFGHCERFALIDADSKSKSIVGRIDVEAPAHQPGFLPGWLAGQGVNVVLTGGMGARAVDLLAQHGIDVVLGVPDTGPEELVEAYLDGRLIPGASACEHPGCGGDHHDRA